MLGYSTFDKSMNGVKTISDGTATISDGILDVVTVNASNILIDDVNLFSRNNLWAGIQQVTLLTDGIATMSNGSVDASALLINHENILTRNNVWGGTQEFTEAIIFDTHTSVIANATTANIEQLGFDTIINNPCIEVVKSSPTITYFPSNSSTISAQRFSSASNTDYKFATITHPAYSTRNYQYRVPLTRQWGSSSSKYSLIHSYPFIGPTAYSPARIVDSYYVDASSTLTAIQVRIMKNGVLHSTITPTIEDFTLPVTTAYRFTVGTGNVEQMIGSFSFDFTPTEEMTSTIWTINLRFTYTETIFNNHKDGWLFENVGIGADDVNNGTFTLTNTSSTAFHYRLFSTITSNIVSHTQQANTIMGEWNETESGIFWTPHPTTAFYYDLIYTLTSSILPKIVINDNYLSQLTFSTGTGIVRANNVVSNRIYNQNHLISKKMICGYMFNGAVAPLGTPYPIFSSTPNLIVDIDDWWLVDAGYIFKLYSSINYATLLGTIDNSDGFEPLFVSSTSVYGGNNQVNSVKVFFINENVANLQEMY